MQTIKISNCYGINQNHQKFFLLLDGPNFLLDVFIFFSISEDMRIFLLLLLASKESSHSILMIICEMNETNVLLLHFNILFCLITFLLLVIKLFIVHFSGRHKQYSLWGAENMDFSVSMCKFPKVIKTV